MVFPPSDSSFRLFPKMSESTGGPAFSNWIWTTLPEVPEKRHCTTPLRWLLIGIGREKMCITWFWLDSLSNVRCSLLYGYFHFCWPIDDWRKRVFLCSHQLFSSGQCEHTHICTLSSNNSKAAVFIFSYLIQYGVKICELCHNTARPIWTQS